MSGFCNLFCSVFLYERSWMFVAAWFSVSVLDGVAALGYLPAEAIASKTKVVELYVTPQGNKNADGSKDRPFRTLHEAQKRVRAIRALNRQQKVRVEIASGDYFLEKPLQFGPKDSGELAPTASTIYNATKPGTVRISGGQKITDWRDVNGVWVTKLRLEGTSLASKNKGDFFTLFSDLWVNGHRAIPARSPNQGFYRIEKAGADDRTSFTVSKSQVLTLANPRTAEVVFLHDWSTSRIRFHSIDKEKRLYRFADAIGPSSAHFTISHFEKHPRYFVENAPELLDAPGEWNLDHATGELRYIPREGESLDTVEVIAPNLKRLIEIHGTDSKHVVDGIQFQGIRFCHTRFNRPPHGWAGIQAAFHERRKKAGQGGRIPQPAGIDCRFATMCRFENCTFQHFAGGGISFGEGCSGCGIYKCLLQDIGGNGIMIGSTDASVVKKGDKPLVENSACNVDSCVIEKCGATYYEAVGIWVGIAKWTFIQNNEIRYLPYTGISLGWRWDDKPTACGQNLLKGNHIHHVMQVLSDGGGIYTLGRQPGTKLTDNIIHDVPVNAGRAESNGIFMDEGSTEISVMDNIIFNISKSPIRFHRAGKNRIWRNILAAPEGVQPFRYNRSKPQDMDIQGTDRIDADQWWPKGVPKELKDVGPSFK